MVGRCGEVFDLSFFEDGSQERVCELFSLVGDDGQGISKDVAPVGNEVGSHGLFRFVRNDDEPSVLGEGVSDNQDEFLLVVVVEEGTV